MKILQVITRGNIFAGAQRHVRDLSVALVERGHSVCVAIGGSGELSEQLAGTGISYRRVEALQRAIRPLSDLRALFQLRALIHELRPNIVACHSSKAGLLGRIAGRTCGVDTVFTAHGWAFSKGVPAPRRLLYRTFERFAGRLSDRVITVSDHDLNLARQQRIVPADRLTRVHNGIADVPPQLLADPSANPVVILMTARFDNQKDQATLLRGLAAVDSDVPWRLRLAGEGRNLSAVADLARNLRIADRVEFLGHRSDVPQLLAGSQIFALTSHWEGLPISILEAMRAGVPVVASDVGGVREAVVHGETGFMTRRGDSAEVATALGALVRNPELRCKQGEAARQRFLHQFTLERQMRETIAVYDQLFASHSVPQQPYTPA